MASCQMHSKQQSVDSTSWLTWNWQDYVDISMRVILGVAQILYGRHALLLVETDQQLSCATADYASEDQVNVWSQALQRARRASPPK